MGVPGDMEEAMKIGKGAFVYPVIMYRWGDTECHSYLLGVYSSKTKAEKAGETERIYRGCTKYYPLVQEVSVDIGEMPFKEIVKLPDVHQFMSRRPR